MTTQTTTRTSQPTPAKLGARTVIARQAAATNRALGIEIEAAEVRAVSVIDGCIPEPQSTPKKNPVAPISAREAAPSGAAIAPAVPARGVPVKSKMVYTRPVNPKLVSARPVAPVVSAAEVKPAVGQVVEPIVPSAPVVRSLTPPDYSIAPAAVLPRFAGEPLRADLLWPPQARGTGEVWPPEAKIEPGETTGRFPLAYAWHMLATRQLWSWNTEGRATQITAADAIAHVISAAAKQQGGLRAASTSAHEATTPTALIIPNHLTEMAQQELLDAAAAQQIHLALLPRPIAAAMAWCDQHASELEADASMEGRSIGSIAVLHFGLDMWEATTVDIIAKRIDGTMRFLPARRRNPIEPLPSYGVELMHRLAIRSLEMSYQQMSPARVWELVWCTPWLKAALSLLSDGNEPFPSVVALAKHARSGEFLKQQCRQATQRIFRAGEPIPGLLRQCLGKTPQFTDIRDWYAARKLEAPAEGFLGAVITGPLANVPCDKDAVGIHHLQKIWAKPVRVMIEGVTTPQGLLARSAGWHADFLRKTGLGETPLVPTYLESLPRVRIAATVEGQATWVDLLEESAPLVAGGVAVKRPEPLTGFPIKPDTTKFKIAVHHEDWPTVQIASARLPQILSQAEPVSLHATLRSSHGFPVIELVPVHEGLFGRHRVLVDMRTMKDTGKKPEEFLKSVGG